MIHYFLWLVWWHTLLISNSHRKVLSLFQALPSVSSFLSDPLNADKDLVNRTQISKECLSFCLLARTGISILDSNSFWWWGGNAIALQLIASRGRHRLERSIRGLYVSKISTGRNHTWWSILENLLICGADHYRSVLINEEDPITLEH